MKSENSKIQSIVNELLANSLEAESTDVNISISRDKEEVTIKVEDNGKGMDEETLTHVEKILNQPYRKDMEEYYGSLAGIGHTRERKFGGLNLVGLQVDYSEVKSSEEGTSILLKRKHEHKNLKTK